MHHSMKRAIGKTAFERQGMVESVSSPGSSSAPSSSGDSSESSSDTSSELDGDKQMLDGDEYAPSINEAAYAAILWTRVTAGPRKFW